MSIRTGNGQEEGTFAVRELSTFRFRDPGQPWIQLDTDPLDPGRLQYIVESLGDRHTLTISKMTDIVSPMLIKAHHTRTRLPMCALHLARNVPEYPKDTIGRIFNAVSQAYDSTLVMTNVSVKLIQSYGYANVANDVIGRIEFITFKVRGTYEMR